MHEQSLVRSLLTQVEQLRREHQALAVSVIEVEIGPLSGVEPELVREAFDRLVLEQFTPETQLVIHEVKLACQCRTCHETWETTVFQSCCPKCHSTSVQILRGDEFRLMNITVQYPMADESEGVAR